MEWGARSLQSPHYQVGLKGLGRKVVRQKSATVNLENLLLEKYLREKEAKKSSLEVWIEIFPKFSKLNISDWSRPRC